MNQSSQDTAIDLYEDDFIHGDGDNPDVIMVIYVIFGICCSLYL